MAVNLVRLMGRQGHQYSFAWCDDQEGMIGMGGGRRAEVRCQMSDVGGRRAENWGMIGMIGMDGMIGMGGGQRTEGGGRRSEVRGRMSDVGGRIFGAIECGLNREGTKNAKGAFGCVFRG